MKIGLMGGSFDPIHYGHLVLAEQIRTKFNLDKIIFIPVGYAPHKKSGQMSNKNHRYSMTLLGTIDNPNFEVSKIEIESDEISYTINTVKKIMEKYDVDDEMYFITGADAIIEIESWKNFRELLSLCRFIAATRPSVIYNDFDKKIRDLNQKYNSSIILTKVSALEISSTDIRSKIANSESIKYLVPDAIEQYIHKNKLYLGDKNAKIL